VKDINLEIKKGGVLGIVGKNGSGKSTLLKLISGILTPTSGTIEVKGNIVALLELGSGFNPEYTGIENIYFYSALMGYTREQIDKVFNDIIEFAELGDFIYQPLKTYSSGMKSRLAFSVSVNIDPEILILDEVLSVGDIFFQAKCTNRMQSMIKNKNTTVLYVSHNIASIKAICERSILLESGRIIMNGESQDVVNTYFKEQVGSQQKVAQKQLVVPEIKKINDKDLSLNYNRDVFLKKASFDRVQNGKAEFYNVQLLDENENIVNRISYGQRVILRLIIQFNENIEKIGCGYNIKEKNGIDLINSGSGIEEKYLYNVKNGSKIIYDFKFKLEIQAGNYSIAVSVSIPNLNNGTDGYELCDFIPIAANFIMEVKKPVKLYGYVHIDNIVEVRELE